MQVTIPTLDSLIEPYKHYPKAIQHALLLVESHPAFSILTKSARRVLKSMVTRCSRHNGTEPIFARVDRLAAEADVCTKTVQRAVAFLKKVGWLEKVSDGRDEGGVFTYRHYWFSADLAALLRLPTPKNDHRTKESSGTYIDLSFKSDQPEISDKESTPPSIELPPALQAATEELGIKDTGIAKLRGEAHKAGHQLEHIIACARERLQKLGAKGSRAFRYLQTMISKPSDYASRAAQTARMAADTAKTTKDKGCAEKYAHKRFIGLGSRVRIFDGTAEVRFDNGEYKFVPAADMPQIYAAIEAGKLREVFE